MNRPGSMSYNDRGNKRLEVARGFVDKLPLDSKVGIFRFDYTELKLTESLISAMVDPADGKVSLCLYEKLYTGGFFTLKHTYSYITILAAAFTVSFLIQGCHKETGPEALTETASPQTEAESLPAEAENVSQNTPAEPAVAEAPSIASPSVCGALHVEGTQLTDSRGNPVLLKGISTHGLSWFPEYVNEECFRQLRQEWNVNVIRLAMYTEEYGGYCSGGDRNALKELVKSGVEYAAAQDLYVIIDWHILQDYDPNMHVDEAKAFFREMAELYAGYDNVLYEICNEPNGGTDWESIKAYAEEVIPVIRSFDEDGIIIIGTPNWSQYVDQAAADPVTGYDNLMYSLHFYAATHTDSLRSAMSQAVNAGLPVFVTEYGICDASGNGSIDEQQAEQWISAMNEYGISYVAWNLSNKDETSAILKSDCSKVSGFTQEDLSDSGKWLYQMLVTGKTEHPL